MTLICLFISLFFWKGKKAGENYITMLPKAWIVHAPFTCYQYVLKKIIALNSINRFMTLTCQIIFAFFFLLREMSRETVQTHIVQKPNTSRPFYLWLIRSKKIYSSEFHKQIHDFDPFTPSLHNHLSNFNQGYLEEKNCFWVFQIGQCCIVT